SRPVLFAGVLGGLLGGLFAFAAGRMIGGPMQEPANAQPVSQNSSSPEARAVLDSFLGKLKDLKDEEFINDVKVGMTFRDASEFEAFKKAFKDSRILFFSMFGQRKGNFDVVRETALLPELVRYVCIEHFEGGAVAWVFILYKTTEGWRVNAILWNKELMLAFPGGS
ncbi:MAG TPA: hypothetical protein VLM40_22645, partial [Gemmata sp.]|nr:hypothetical protein [Gemmata sp.]